MSRTLILQKDGHDYPVHRVTLGLNLSMSEDADGLPQLNAQGGAGGGLNADMLDGHDSTEFVLKTEVGIIGGPAGPLDSGGKVPVAQIPTGLTTLTRLMTLKFDLIGGTASVAFPVDLASGATITEWELQAYDASDAPVAATSAVVDVLRAPAATTLTFTSIAGTDKPTLTSQQRVAQAPSGGWGSTALNDGDTIKATVQTLSGSASRLVLALRLAVTDVVSVQATRRVLYGGTLNLSAPKLEIPVDLGTGNTATVVAAYVVLDATGSATVTTRRAPAATSLTFTRIDGSTDLTLTSQQRVANATLAGWTTTINDGDTLEATLGTLSGGATYATVVYVLQVGPDTSGGVSGLTVNRIPKALTAKSLTDSNLNDTGTQVQALTDFQTQAGRVRKVTSVSATTTLGATHDVLQVTATATLNLPASATNVGREYTVIPSTGVTVTLDPNSTELIDGAATLAATVPIRIVCDGTGWRTANPQGTGTGGSTGGGGPTAATTDYVRARLTSNVSVATGTWTTVTWSDAPDNPSAMWSAGTPSRITILRTGFYLFGSRGNFAAATTEHYARILKNGVSTIPMDMPAGHDYATSFAESRILTIQPAYFVAGDYIEVQYYQNSGGPLNLMADQEYPTFWAFLVQGSTNSGTVLGDSFTYWDGDKPPTTPSVYDDEFTVDGAINSKWTWQNQSNATATVSNGQLWFNSGTSAVVTNSQRQLLQTAPAASWTITTRVKNLGFRQFNMAGLYIRSSTGTAYNWGIYPDNSTGYWSLQLRKLTSDTSESGSVTLGATTDSDLFLRVSNDGTNLVFYFSTDGRKFTQCTGLTIASFLGNVQKFGIALDPIGTSGFDAAFEFFRLQNSVYTGAEGGLRVVGTASPVVTTAAASYTLGAGDNGTVLLVDVSTADCTVNLPPAATSASMRVGVKVKALTTGFRVIVDGNAAETIDGAPTAVLASPYQSLTMVCDGTGWYIV
jgi:hypothetical protein